MANQVSLVDDFSEPIKFIGDTDVGLEDDGSIIWAAIVVLSCPYFGCNEVLCYTCKDGFSLYSELFIISGISYSIGRLVTN